MACYCDDLIIVHKDPEHVFDSMRRKGFTIKETSAPDYFLGGDFERVKEPNTNNKILAWGSTTYVKRMMDNFNNILGFEPSKKHAAIPPDYKTELETPELFTDTENAQYWQCIDDMQCAVTLGRTYIMYATVLLLRYRPTPCKGHFYKIHHIYGYLKNKSQPSSSSIQKHLTTITLRLLKGIGATCIM